MKHTSGEQVRQEADDGWLMTDLAQVPLPLREKKTFARSLWIGYEDEGHWSLPRISRGQKWWELFKSLKARAGWSLFLVREALSVQTAGRNHSIRNSGCKWGLSMDQPLRSSDEKGRTMKKHPVLRKRVFYLVLFLKRTKEKFIGWI